MEALKEHYSDIEKMTVVINNLYHEEIELFYAFTQNFKLINTCIKKYGKLKVYGELIKNHNYDMIYYIISEEYSEDLELFEELSCIHGNGKIHVKAMKVFELQEKKSGY